MNRAKIDALLALRSEGRFLVGRERIRLLEAITEHKSIGGAAGAVGYSYKTAWDAVNAINNLLPGPAVVTKTGGRGGGGGAEVTAEGRRLIATFHRLEERLARIAAIIAREGLEEQEDFLLFALGVSFSTRNVFQAEVLRVEKGPVDVEVTLRGPSGHAVSAVVTNEAAEELALAPGRRVLALVKAPFIELSRPEFEDKRQLNRFDGKIVRCVDAARKSEIVIDVGGAKAMTAVVPRETAERLKLKVGARIVARFDPENVILAAC
ncbi:MAG: TOBE domain-containing protein [Methylocystis sp.]|nr:TOBE domain-containing protein [Methylocystis sp.]